MQTSINRLRTTAPAGLLPLVLAALVAAAPAEAAKPGHRAAPPHKIVSKGEASRTHLFSVNQITRKARALPAPVAPASPARGKQAKDGPEARVAPARPAKGASARIARTPIARTAAVQNGAWSGSYAANPNRQIGKLYFDIIPGPGVDWKHCSATAVNSENKSVVVTAGHCLFNADPDKNDIIDGNGYWMEHVQFCPGYEYGCKLGVWEARQMYTTNSWFYGDAYRRYDWSDDMAVVLVKPNADGYLVNAVGGHGIAFNTTTGQYRHAFGYPVSDYRWPDYSYSGEDLVYCPSYDAYDGAGHLKINCTVTGGASGGPWLSSVSSAWWGTVNSVNSHKPWGGPYEGGPYFGSAESNTFQYARAR